MDWVRRGTFRLVIAWWWTGRPLWETTWVGWPGTGGGAVVGGGGTDIKTGGAIFGGGGTLSLAKALSSGSTSAGCGRGWFRGRIWGPAVPVGFEIVQDLLTFLLLRCSPDPCCWAWAIPGGRMSLAFLAPLKIGTWFCLEGAMRSLAQSPVATWISLKKSKKQRSELRQKLVVSWSINSRTFGLSLWAPPSLLITNYHPKKLTFRKTQKLSSRSQGKIKFWQLCSTGSQLVIFSNYCSSIQDTFCNHLVFVSDAKPKWFWNFDNNNCAICPTCARVIWKSSQNIFRASRVFMWIPLQLHSLPKL